MAKFRVHIVNKLDRARTKAKDQMIPVWKCSCGRAMPGCHGFWQSLEPGRAQVAGWFAMVCMAKGLLHCCTGVLAQVYVHFCGERCVH